MACALHRCVPGDRRSLCSRVRPLAKFQIGWCTRFMKHLTSGHDSLEELPNIAVRQIDDSFEIKIRARVRRVSVMTKWNKVDA